MALSTSDCHPLDHLELHMCKMPPLNLPSDSYPLDLSDDLEHGEARGADDDALGRDDIEHHASTGATHISRWGE